MDITVDDYFVITRGARVQAVSASVAGMEVQVPRIYDMTWHGIVLQVREVQLTLVVAEIVGLSAGSVQAPVRAIGTRHVIDLAKVEWQPVSKLFAQLLSQPPQSVPAAGGYATGGVVTCVSHVCADERDQT